MPPVRRQKIASHCFSATTDGAYERSTNWNMATEVDVVLGPQTLANQCQVVVTRRFSDVLAQLIDRLDASLLGLCHVANRHLGRQHRPVLERRHVDEVRHDALPVIGSKQYQQLPPPTTGADGPRNDVELGGLEPPTYSLRTNRATTCAIAPDAPSSLSSGADANQDHN